MKSFSKLWYYVLKKKSKIFHIERKTQYFQLIKLTIHLLLFPLHQLAQNLTPSLHTNIIFSLGLYTHLCVFLSVCVSVVSTILFLDLSRFFQNNQIADIWLDQKNYMVGGEGHEFSKNVIHLFCSNKRLCSKKMKKALRNIYPC